MTGGCPKPVVVPAVRDELELGLDAGHAYLDSTVGVLDDELLVQNLSYENEEDLQDLRSRLDPGEAESLFGAIEHCGTLATDDLAARKIADQRDVPVTGSIGLLVLGVESDHLDRDTAGEWLETWRERRGYYAPVESVTEILDGEGEDCSFALGPQRFERGSVSLCQIIYCPSGSIRDRIDARLVSVVAQIGCLDALNVAVQSGLKRLRVVVVCGVDAIHVLFDALEERPIDRRSRTIAISFPISIGRFQEPREADRFDDDPVVPRVFAEKSFDVSPELVDGRFERVAEPRKKSLAHLGTPGEFVDDERAKVVERCVVDHRLYAFALVRRRILGDVQQYRHDVLTLPGTGVRTRTYRTDALLGEIDGNLVES